MLNTYHLLGLVGIPPTVMAILAQLDIPAGLENISGIAVLGFLCYIILTKVCKHLETLGEKLDTIADKLERLDTPQQNTSKRAR